ncbi:MAG: hypothetical protein V3V08_08085 [Nannocystaceae bacterium]
MSFADELDSLPKVESTARQRFLDALSLFDEGLEMQRLTFRRRHRDASDAEIEKLLLGWLAREDEDP